MLYPDVIVMGVGRSGTSTIARILYDQLGVCMGKMKDWIGSYNHDPSCTYESKMMMKPTRWLVNREGQELAHQADRNWEPTQIHIDLWLGMYQRLHRNCASRKWHGVKNTQLSLCSVEQLQALKPKLVVRTWRLRNENIDSLLRTRSHRYAERSHWETFYDERMVSMDILESQSGIPFVTIDFPCYREDEAIVRILKPSVDKWVKGKG